jgi:hypothetical protein
MSYSQTTRTLYSFFKPLHPLSILLKLLIVITVAAAIESSPTQPSWAIVMVLFAALFLVPIAFQQIKKSQSLFRMYRYGLICQLLCAISLAMSFLMERGIGAGIFAIPYAVWCMEMLFYGLKIERKLTYLTTLITFGFLANASLWLVFDRFGVQPLGFSMWIVILTGVHFHFAGFALMACLSLFLYQNPKNRFIQMAIIMTIFGIILTALGITATQLGYGQALESASGTWVAISSFLVGLFFIKKSFKETPLIKALWFLGGMSLVLAMILASLYALRSVIPIEALTLPIMQALHGTLNALGFGNLVLIGWALRKTSVIPPP